MTGAFCFYEYDSTSYKVVNLNQTKSNIPKKWTHFWWTHPHSTFGGTPLFICYMPLSHQTGKKVVIGITSQTGLLIFLWFICRIILYNRVIMPFLADKMKKLTSILILFVFLVVPDLIFSQQIYP
jgi:hypothetical protein